MEHNESLRDRNRELSSQRCVGFGGTKERFICLGPGATTCSIVSPQCNVQIEVENPNTTQKGVTDDWAGKRQLHPSQVADPKWTIQKKTHQFACHVMPETRIQNKARDHATQQIHATENSLPNHLPSSKVIYSLILGMCLTKKNGYPIYSSRRQQIRLQQNCIFFLRALLSSRLLLLCFSHFEPSRVCDWGVFSVSVLPLLLLVY